VSSPEKYIKQLSIGGLKYFRVRVSVSIVCKIATGGYSWIWPKIKNYWYIVSIKEIV